MTLTLTQKCFSTFLPLVLSGKPQVFSCLHFTSPAPWISIRAFLDCWSKISFGSMSSGATKTATPQHFLHKEGSNTPWVYLDTDIGFPYIWLFPPDKTGGRYDPKHLSAVDLQTPHSEMEDFCSPNMKKPKYRTSFMGATKCSKSYRMMGAVV